MITLIHPLVPSSSKSSREEDRSSRACSSSETRYCRYHRFPSLAFFNYPDLPPNSPSHFSCPACLGVGQVLHPAFPNPQQPFDHGHQWPRCRHMPGIPTTSNTVRRYRQGPPSLASISDAVDSECPDWWNMGPNELHVQRNNERGVLGLVVMLAIVRSGHSLHTR
jgi:hypothetical protein